MLLDQWGVGAVAIGGLLLFGLLAFIKQLITKVNEALVNGIMEWFRSVNAMKDAVVEIRDSIATINEKFDDWKAEINKAVDTRLSKWETDLKNVDLRLQKVEGLYTPRANEAGSIEDRKL